MIESKGLQKVEIVAGLHDAWSAISQFGANLSEAQWDLESRCPGWTVRDLVSHMLGTELMLGGTPAPAVEVGEADHIHNDIGSFNEAWVIERRARPGAEVIAEFDEVTAARRAVLERMSQSEFDEEAWTPAGHATFGRFMQIRAFDCWMHEQDMRAAVDEPGHLAGPAVQLSLAEMSNSLGFVVGKRAGAPKGSNVALIINGSTKRRFDLAVTDRARLVSAPVLNPTATVSTDLATFAALVGGRIDPEGPIAGGLVQLEGDLELAERVARNLAFVI